MIEVSKTFKSCDVFQEQTAKNKNRLTDEVDALIPEENESDICSSPTLPKFK